MTAFRSGCLATVSLVVVLAGCSGPGSVGPKTVPASGKVTYKNQPVEGAVVSFLGDASTKPAMGMTDSSGEFFLTTGSKPGDGAVPGTYRVTVTKIIGSAKPATKGPTSMEDAAKAAQAPAPTKPLSMLPEKYNAVESSGLQFTVKAGAKNEFPIELVD